LVRNDRLFRPVTTVRLAVAKSGSAASCGGYPASYRRLLAPPSTL